MNTEKRTLELVNNIRTALGAKHLDQLRPGVQGNYCECPIANSLKDVIPGIRVSRYGLELPHRTKFSTMLLVSQATQSYRTTTIYGFPAVYLPPEMHRFIRGFDKRKRYRQRYRHLQEQPHRPRPHPWTGSTHYTSGSFTVKVVPLPISLFTSIVPLWSVTI